MRLKSYAKLNLYLEVENIRRDNYHNIITLFERISLYDEVRIKPRRDGKIFVTCDNKNVPSGESNIAYRAADLLRQKARGARIDKGVDIHIIKRIPVAAGLGGGSSNAAAVLSGLNRLWKLNFSRKKLLDVASQVGCDVPFFLYDTSFALGTERGDKIRPLAGINVRLWHVLAAPDLAVSTPSVYKKLDKRGLTKPLNNVKILLLALRKSGRAFTGEFLFNRLEEATFQLYPQIKDLKDRLRRRGLESILMSGSGPAIFGIVSSRKEGESFCRQLSKSGKLRIFVVRTA